MISLVLLKSMKILQPSLLLFLASDRPIKSTQNQGELTLKLEPTKKTKMVEVLKSIGCKKDPMNW